VSSDVKKIRIRGKFISIISIVTVVLLTAMALVIISTVNKSQSQQANAFIDLLKAEQVNEERASGTPFTFTDLKL